MEVTNDIKKFFEQETGKIFIYGVSGEFGYWIGYYLRECNIPCDGYIYYEEDFPEGTYFNDYPMYKIEKMGQFANERVRIIVASMNANDYLNKLAIWVNAYKWDGCIMLPVYDNLISNGKIYNINAFLGYFRRKLYNGPVPTIIANDCISGIMYQILGMQDSMLSPTVNIGISAVNFLKLAQNPQHYFKESEIKFKSIKKYGTPPALLFSLDDIVLTFGHVDIKSDSKYIKKLINRWNYMVDQIQWDNILFVLRLADGREVGFEGEYVPYGFEQEFCNIKYPHLLIRTSNYISAPSSEDYIFDPKFATREGLGLGSVVETHFDILGWLNKHIKR